MNGLIPMPARAAKPRTSGLTHVLDSGLGPLEVESLLAVGAAHIDLVRLGWGSALVTDCLERKLELYRAAGVPVMLGGTLTELAWAHGRVDELAAVARGARHRPHRGLQRHDRDPAPRTRRASSSSSRRG